MPAIQDCDFVSTVYELIGDVAAEEARSSRDECLFHADLTSNVEVL
jgi:hypothetical protein